LSLMVDDDKVLVPEIQEILKLHQHLKKINF